MRRASRYNPRPSDRRPPAWLAWAAALAVLAQLALPGAKWLHERFGDDLADHAVAALTAEHPSAEHPADGHPTAPAAPHHHDAGHCSICQSIAAAHAFPVGPAVTLAVDQPVYPGPLAFAPVAAPVRPHLAPQASPRAPPTVA